MNINPVNNIDSLPLSKAELETAKILFDSQGYIGPYNLEDMKAVTLLSERLWKEEKVIKAARRIERLSKSFLGSLLRFDHTKKNFSTNRHLDMSEIQDILQDKNLKFVLKNLCASNLLLWRTFLTRKGSGSRELGWHHDKHFQNGDQPFIDLGDISNHFSVLIAINDMTETNGVFRVILGSHKPIVGFERDLRIKANKPFADHILYKIPEQLESRVREITLKKGQFIVFHSALFHGSEAYKSGVPRISLAMRFMTDTIEFPVLNNSIEINHNQLIRL